MTPETLEALLAAKRGTIPVVLATRLEDGSQTLLPDAAASPALNAAAEAALAADRSQTVTLGGTAWFLHVHNPAPRLIVIGAVHIAQALTRLAGELGFAVTVIDPRRGFAAEARFPGVTLLTDWPDEALDTLPLTRSTAIVTLTHDPKLDDPALDRALRSQAFYIGALGSRKTHAARRGRLAALGHAEAALDRIHGPVGLDIGAVTAPEIALSILAQITATRRGPKHG